MPDGPPRDDRRDYRPEWQCGGCGEIYAEHPERCPDCGHDSFRAVER